MTAVRGVERLLRHLVVVLGDQLNPDASAFDGFDPAHDLVWMAEVAEESTHVWSSKPRTAYFLSAMRHFAAELRARNIPLAYRTLDDPANLGTLSAELAATLADLRPRAVVVTHPGDWRTLAMLRDVATHAAVPLDVRDDRHFLCTVDEFAHWSRGRSQVRLEHFYRAERRRHGILMDGDQPCGGRWNFDEDNREAFGPFGPEGLPVPVRVPPDAITREVIAVVNDRFANHPGTLESFSWPVTRHDALDSLDRFVHDRLPHFGRWQDAMWADEPWLFHSHLSAALNVKLLSPREVVDAGESAYRQGRAPLSAVEGFIRQVLGWREYVRGIYWTRMPEYADLNELDAHEPLPDWYWTGATDMRCLSAAIGQTLEHGYAHHIQRLMVTGLFALLLGVEPRAVHEWYLAVYVDAVEWVELPNTLGMSQHADGGLMASKPYVASGKYIDRMSNYCQGCQYDPAKPTGQDACPFTTLYWDFLLRHDDRFASHPRMALQVKNARRISAADRAAVAERASQIRAGVVGGA